MLCRTSVRGCTVGGHVYLKPGSSQGRDKVIAIGSDDGGDGFEKRIFEHGWQDLDRAATEAELLKYTVCNA